MMADRVSLIKCVDRYIFITTRSLVRAQGIITQLVFEHALRIRMKAETPKTAKSEDSTVASTTVSTPDTASVVENAESRPGSSQDGDETALSTTLTTDSTSEAAKSKKDAGTSSEDAKKPKEAEKSSDLIGKITNLVSTDLQNIVNGRDFLVIVVAAPIQTALCTAFLYAILGWRSARILL